MYSKQLGRKKIFQDISVNQKLNHLQIERSFITSSKESVTASIDEELKLTEIFSNDKLHRRNPVTVRLEIQSYDDLIPEANLGDLQLSEMPGLQNTEQWKRIAGRIGQGSPPLSLEYYQQATSVLTSPHEPMPEVLYLHSPSNQPTNDLTPSSSISVNFHKSRAKIGLGSALFVIAIAIIIGIVVGVVLVRKSKNVTTDRYYGSVIVNAPFDPALLSLSSTLAMNYQQEFCSLVGTTLSVLKTKYAIFFSDCSVNSFRNGSIIGNFILGFTRYQNSTRLSTFLNRTLVNRQVFGGAILSLNFNLSASTPDIPDYTGDYDEIFHNLTTVEQF